MDTQPGSPQRQQQSGLVARLMTLFFRLLYHSFAWTYDLVADIVSLGRWRRWVLAAGERLPGQRVLELGFGPGHLQAHLHSIGREIYGLDESAQMARLAHRRLARRTGLRLSRGLAQALPYPDGAFDSVVATFPTLYIFHPSSLAEIKRVLRPAGELVVLSAAWHTGRSLPERLMAFVFRITGQTPPADQVTDSQLTHPFVQAGFSTRLEWVEVPGSRLLFMIAVKK
jgi:ubiquinone/menaquinone biosynthesis C-methylase UbiE